MADSRVNFVINNLHVLPYNRRSDTLKLKVVYREGLRQKYSANISGDVYGNIAGSGDTHLLTTFETNDFGVAYINYPTNAIPDQLLNTAKFWASGYHDSFAKEIQSNVCRADFIFTAAEASGNIIDGGTCGDIDSLNRSGFCVYDATRPFLNINFNDYSIDDWGAGTTTHEVAVQDDGDRLYISGNAWKKIDFPYNVTADTILSFEFMNDVEGEIHGISMASGTSHPADEIFQLYGTQAFGNSDFQNYQSGEFWRHYEIPIGNYISGSTIYLAFANDYDALPTISESYFKNVFVYESGTVFPKTDNDFFIIDRMF